MVFDGVPYSELAASTGNLKQRAIRTFIERLERALGVSVLVDRRTLPYESPDLQAPLQIAQRLLQSGVIRDLQPASRYPDEVPLIYWGVTCNLASGHRSGGTSFESDVDALYAALAEALERYLWFEPDDYFKRPILATASEIAERGACIFPERFASFSREQRASNPKLTLLP